MYDFERIAAIMNNLEDQLMTSLAGVEAICRDLVELRRQKEAARQRGEHLLEAELGVHITVMTLRKGQVKQEADALAKQVNATWQALESQGITASLLGM